MIKEPKELVEIDMASKISGSIRAYKANITSWQMKASKAEEERERCLQKMREVEERLETFKKLNHVV